VLRNRRRRHRCVNRRDGNAPPGRHIRCYPSRRRRQPRQHAADATTTMAATKAAPAMTAPSSADGAPAAAV